MSPSVLGTKMDAATTGTGEQGANGDQHPDGDGDSGAAVPRTTQRIPLPHNSLFVMGLATNSRWMHSVHTDKRPENTKVPAERSPRISLTFHHIGTFLTPSRPAGQGQ
jgi:hypothetical protein